MTNFVVLVSGFGNGRALAVTSTGRFSGTRAAWVLEAMMRFSFSPKNSTRAFARREQKLRDARIIPPRRSRGRGISDRVADRLTLTLSRRGEGILPSG